MNINRCASSQWNIKRNRVWETTRQFIFVYDLPAPCIRLFSRKPIAGRSSFDFNRLMLLHVNSRYNHVAWGQLFLVYKIERSRPLFECGYSIIERERRKTIVDLAITAFPRRDPEPQEDERTFSFFLFILSVLSRFITLRDASGSSSSHPR